MGMEGMSSWDIPALAAADDDLSSRPVAMNLEQKCIFSTLMTELNLFATFSPAFILYVEMNGCTL